MTKKKYTYSNLMRGSSFDFHLRSIKRPAVKATYQVFQLSLRKLSLWRGVMTARQLVDYTNEMLFHYEQDHFFMFMNSHTYFFSTDENYGREVLSNDWSIVKFPLVHSYLSPEMGIIINEHGVLRALDLISELDRLAPYPTESMTDLLEYLNSDLYNGLDLTGHRYRNRLAIQDYLLSPEGIEDTKSKL